MARWNIQKALALAIAESESPASQVLHGERDGFAFSFETPNGSVIVRDSLNSANNVDTPADTYFWNSNSIPKILLDKNGVWKYGPHNFFSGSNDWNVSWNKTASLVVVDNVAGPNGTFTGFRIQGNSTGSGGVSLSRNLDDAKNELDMPLVWRMYVKEGSRKWIRVTFTGHTGTVPSMNAFVDLANGVIGSANITPGYNWVNIAPAPDGWYELTGGFRLSNTHSNSLGFNFELADTNLDTTIDRTPNSWVFVTNTQLTYGNVVPPYFHTPNGSFGMMAGLPIAYSPELGHYYLQHEQSSTNRLLWSCNLVNVAWQTSNVERDQTETDIFGIPGRASRIIANAENAVIYQTFVHASSVRLGSTFVKRLTGNGQIWMTIDGANWSTLNSIANTWSRESIPERSAFANGNVGFMIQTTGDSFAISYVQCENHTSSTSRPTSPIYTTSTAVTKSPDRVRTLDEIRFPIPRQNVEFSFYEHFSTPENQGGTRELGFFSDKSNRNWVSLRTSTGNVASIASRANNAAGPSVNFSSPWPPANANVWVQVTGGFKGNLFAGVIDANDTIRFATSYTQPNTLPQGMNCLSWGTSFGSITDATIYVRKGAIIPRLLSNTELPNWRH